MTALNELIKWTLENAFNIEGQDGTQYVAIDHEAMGLKFDEWLEKEKQQIITAWDKGYAIGCVNGAHDLTTETGTDTGEHYYNKNYGQK